MALLGTLVELRRELAGDVQQDFVRHVGQRRASAGLPQDQCMLEDRERGEDAERGSPGLVDTKRQRHRWRQPAPSEATLRNSFPSHCRRLVLLQSQSHALVLLLAPTAAALHLLPPRAHLPIEHHLAQLLLLGAHPCLFARAARPLSQCDRPREKAPKQRQGAQN